MRHNSNSGSEWNITSNFGTSLNVFALCMFFNPPFLIVYGDVQGQEASREL